MNKTILIYGGLAVVGVVGLGYLVSQYSNIFNGVSDLVGGETEEEQVDDNKKKLQDALGQGMKPTYTDAEYKEGANKLDVAINKVGNDLDMVVEVFDGVMNVVDARKLFSAYGIRKGDTMTEALRFDLVSQVGVPFVSVKSVTGDINLFNKLNLADVVREILKRKNIQYPI